MSEPTDWPPEEVSAFRAAVLEYFRHERRTVPWREDRDPYRVLVSEFMLQQTRTETVIPYFRSWTALFPDVERLAEVEVEAVLKQWEGLGYYSRARNLHRTAREIVARYQGRVPSEPDELRTLPGVGEYTAGAVASIAFGVPVPAVDGNVRRVMARVADDPSPAPSTLRRWAQTLVDPSDPGAFNQGLMEIGSRVCLPRGPDCKSCPLAALCRANAAGTQEERPRRKPKRTVPFEHRAVAVIVRSGATPHHASVRLRRRPSQGLLAGMWEVPSSRIDHGQDAASLARALATGLLEGPFHAASTPLSTVAHAFSHLKVTYRPFLFVVQPGRGDGDETTEALQPGESDERWVRIDELYTLPVPVAQRKILTDAVESLDRSGQGPKDSRPGSPDPPSGD